MTSEPAGPTPSQSDASNSGLNRLKAPEPAPTGNSPDTDEELFTFDMGEAVEEAPPTVMPLALPVPAIPVAIPVVVPPVAPPAAEAPVEAKPVEVLQLSCPLCDAPRSADQKYCHDCGFFFPVEKVATAPAAPVASSVAQAANQGGTPTMLSGRYEVGALLCEKAGVFRYKGRDMGGLVPGRPIVIVKQAVSVPDTVTLAEVTPVPVTPADTEEVLPGWDEPVPAAPVTDTLPPQPAWPSVAWERNLLETLNHPGLPTVLDSFTEEGFEFLILEVPQGRSLWDTWDDPDVTCQQRFGWLAQVAETLQSLHKFGCLLEGIRPEIVVIEGTQARLTDLSDLLPLPVPADAPLRGRLYTAPELLASPQTADARADLYSFGAMLYALHVGRELSEADFDRPGHPKPFLPRFPDVHPAFGRLLAKTFCRAVESRFPTDEAQREDHTGFTELIRTLRVCGRTLDRVRLEIASWTTTGMVRTGNEDAFALLYACESRQDDVAESALILLCDGMGGYEAGEVAAALAIKALRANLTQQKPFRQVSGASGFLNDLPGGHDGNLVPTLNVEEAKAILKAALKDANKQVWTAARTPGVGKRGMGCTAEAVYIDSRNLVVGHVGDSRTYHLHEGTLKQLTRDQTLVNRLVELGTLTPEEAEDHPRKNELQQAIGGQPDVEPGLYAATLSPGDWVVVCSDGVSNHINAAMLKDMLQKEATSAEMAARRLINWTNIEGATDNATVVVVRVT